MTVVLEPPVSDEVIVDASPNGGFFVRSESAAAPSLHVDAARWCRRDFEFWSFDRSCEAAWPLAIAVDGDRTGRTAAQVALRCQRLSPRTNPQIESSQLARVLGAHRSLHDLSLPLVTADYAHSLDVWQWLLRIEPNASAALQFAALFHDVERLDSESLRRVEHEAADYQRFKNDHAARGACVCRSVLIGAGVDGRVAGDAAALVMHSEAAIDADSALLNDADALSFLSLNSPGFFDYFDAEHCAKKVEYTLRRITSDRLHYIDQIGLRDDVAEVVQRERRALAQ